jgi:hypothetical protein
VLFAYDFFKKGRIFVPENSSLQKTIAKVTKGDKVHFAKLVLPKTVDFIFSRFFSSYSESGKNSAFYTLLTS